MREGLRQLEARIVEAASRIDSLTNQLLIDLRQFDEQKGWRASGSISCVHWLTTRLGWDRVTASERMRVARRLATLPRTDAAYLAGELSYSKVRALVRVATPESEETFLVHARACTAAELERICRRSRGGRTTRSYPRTRRRVRRRSLDDGRVQIEAVFDAADAEVVWEALRIATDSAESPTTDAVVALARAYLASRHAETQSPSASTIPASTQVAPATDHKRTAAAPSKPKQRASRVDVSPTRLPARHAPSRSRTRRVASAKASARSPGRSPPARANASTSGRARRVATRDGP